MDLAELGKRIQQVREQILDLKQSEIAKDLGTVQTLISRLERGIGGNIHLLMDIVNYLNNKGYPAHLLFAKDFEISLIKKGKNASDGNNAVENPMEAQIAELKYFMQKGFEKAITLESLIITEQAASKKPIPKKLKSSAKRK